MQSIIQKLSDIVGTAFVAEGLEASFGRVVFSDRPDLAQFQCNGAMSAAKAAKQNPRAVAEKIIGHLQNNDLFLKVEIAGPGFINLTLKDNVLSEHVSAIAGDERSGVPVFNSGDTIVLDYGGPNIAKAMHVGHLRSGIIGDTLRRILSFAGYKTLGDIHMGDWGTHMGMLFNDYMKRGEQNIVLDTDLSDPESVQRLFDDMGERYPRASGAAKEDEAIRAEALEATVKLQNGDPLFREMWEKVRAVSVMAMEKNYRALNVEFDLWKGEADVHELIAPMVEKLKAGHYAIPSDGAIVIPVMQNDDTKEYPPLILVKRDGGFMYGTTDLATLQERMDLYKPAKIIYVVDQRQHLHFEQVFRAAKIGGIVPKDVELTHAGHGTMNGTDGKPFKTRAGGVLKLEDLIAMGLQKARERLHEAGMDKDVSPAELEDIAHKVAIAAIKFADLQNNRIADYVFDLDRLTQFEGKTGPYLLYQAVRIKSLLQKADAQGFKAGSNILSIDENRSLLLLLSAFPESVDNAVRNYTPHVLCDHAYKLAQEFSAFYAKVHILSETDEVKRASLILLCRAVYAQLEKTLGLLGIDIPERM
ncbi:MAG: arginine--tRNA ligase [Micavibrio aeruginosavorus]|uniref:Arginine--tRNA ligase n=1 Tax=Micavibrio aeruginosavorus TaxID=349221 RepID=A0A2W5FR66_9BACT|nr:MAG: arginine--tRNA ligase [Micavibrio aeruginosavorus]